MKINDKLKEYIEENIFPVYKKNSYSKIDEMSFIDTNEDKKIIIENIINDFLKKNDLDITMLKKEKAKFSKIVKLLKEDYNLSYSEIAKKLNTNKAMIYRMVSLN